MSRLTIELPADLGGRAAGDRERRTDYRADVDDATAAFVDWHDCWAGD